MPPTTLNSEEPVKVQSLAHELIYQFAASWLCALSETASCQLEDSPIQPT